MPPIPIPKTAQRSPALLQVIPNIYKTYDHKGRLSAAVRFDPQAGRPGEIHHVGSVVTTTVLESRGEIQERQGVKFSPDPRGDVRETTVLHALEIEEIPNTEHHLRMLRDRALLPVNFATARLARLATKPEDFVPPGKALIAARAELVAKWNSEYPEEEAPLWPTVEELDLSAIEPQKPAPAAPAAPAAPNGTGSQVTPPAALAAPATPEPEAPATPPTTNPTSKTGGDL